MLERLHVLINVKPDTQTKAMSLLRAVLDAGQPLIQLRMKGLTDRESVDLAHQVVDECHARSVRCVINDRADIALATKADGVHLGEHDLPVDTARRILGADAIIGGTARNPVDALRLQHYGATYLGCGPAFATTTKSGLPAPLGPDGVKLVADAVAIPVIGIGSINSSRVSAMLHAGCHGVAVINAIAGAVNPTQTTAHLLHVIHQHFLKQNFLKPSATDVETRV